MMLKRCMTHIVKYSVRCFHTSPAHYTIPYIIERHGNGERMYDIYSRLLKDRIIFLNRTVDDVMASSVTAQLLFLQSDDPKKPINMYINSPGGSVTAGLAIYDTMQYVSPPIATWCIGQAMSMGSLLLCAGTEGMRTALPNSIIMVHQARSGTQGPITDIEIQTDHLRKLKKQLNGIYVKHTKLPMEKIELALERDKYLTPEEALEFGIIDKIESGTLK